MPTYKGDLLEVVGKVGKGGFADAVTPGGLRRSSDFTGSR
jgi:hypothetical protein